MPVERNKFGGKREILYFTVLRIRDVYDPDFDPSWIPDPKTATKERGEKKLVVKPFL
jgi:hypothetical protein